MNYLWYQPSSFSQRDEFLINGEPVEDVAKRSAFYDEVSRLFNGIDGNASFWCGRSKVSRSFYLLKGLFKTKDEAGRFLAFMFASDNRDFRAELEDISRIIGQEVQPETQDAIEAFMKREESRIKDGPKFLAIAAAVLLIAILAYFFLS